MTNLAEKECTACAGGVPPLASDEVQCRLGELGHGWEVVGGHHLSKTFGVTT